MALQCQLSLQDLKSHCKCESVFEIREKGLPKLSHLVQQEFYRALRTLRTHELQDSNMKAAIEFARDLLCIDEIDFDRWFKGKSSSVLCPTPLIGLKKL